MKSSNFKLIGLILIFFNPFGQGSKVFAQDVLFDFDSIAVHTPLPVSSTKNGITAHFSGTGQGYSIQDANVLGFTPAGFSGHVIYPNSINLADLLIYFDNKITDFSIMYSCQELGCDDAATMRVTAYLKGSLAGTNTKMTSHPGTWPTDTLHFSFAQGFDSVVVHYDKRPPTCQDFGVVFLADNMRVTSYNQGALISKEPFIEKITIPSPVTGVAFISVWLSQPRQIRMNVYGINGRFIKNIFNGYLNTGEQKIKLEMPETTIKSGLYILKIDGEAFSATYKFEVQK